jgi:hypothetical protein
VFDLGAFAVQNALQGKYGSDMRKVWLLRLTLQGRIAHLGYPVAEPGRESYSGWPAEDVCVRWL